MKNPSIYWPLEKGIDINHEYRLQIYWLHFPELQMKQISCTSAEEVKVSNILDVSPNQMHEVDRHWS